MNSKKLTALIVSLTVVIAVVATLSVADNPRELVSTAVSEPAMSLEVDTPDTLQSSQLADNEAQIPKRCCCPDGNCYGPPPCSAGCVASINCIVCPALADEYEEQIQVTWVDPYEEVGTIADEQGADDSAMCCPWCCPDGSCDYSPNSSECVQTISCNICPW